MKPSVVLLFSMFVFLVGFTPVGASPVPDSSAVVALLRSGETNDLLLARDLLADNPVQFIAPDGILIEDVLSALLNCYRRLPAFPATLEITANKAEVVTHSPKVFFFMLLAEHGGEKGAAIVKDAAQGPDPVFRTLAEERLATSHVAISRVESSRPAAVNTTNALISLPELSNHVSRALEFGDFSEKQSAIRSLLLSRRQLRCAENEAERAGILAVLKSRFETENNLAVREELLTAVANLEKPSETRAYFGAIESDTNAPSILRNHAKYLREALDAGVFR